MKYLLIIAVMLSVLGLTTACFREWFHSSGYRLYTSGDPKSIGAGIFIDGDEVGVMEKRVNSETGEIFSIGVGLEYSESRKKPDYDYYDQIKVQPGKHVILFVSKGGDRLSKEIETQSESYIHVSFDEMRIQGGDKED